MKYSPAKRAALGLLGIATAALDRPYAAKCFTAAFTGQWEGGDHDRRRNRPGKRMASQDTDLNYGMREKLLSEARSLEQTFPIAKRVKNQYADYCVGRCNIRWNTGNATHDASFREGWKSWMPIADYKNMHAFPKLMKLAAGGAWADGDTFVQLLDSNSFSQINLIEADRVSSHGIYNNDCKDMIGGVGLFNGRPNKIRVWERTIYGMFENPVEIPAKEYRHLFFTSRYDAMRGVTGLHCILDALRDVKEVDDAQRLKTKRNSKLALLVKVITGQAPRGKPFDDDDAEPVGPQVTHQRVDDATDAYMFPNEDMKAHETNTPGDAWQNHMEFMIRLIAIGSNLPFGVLWNMAGLGKPGVLFELEQASRTFRGTQDDIESRLIRPIAGWWLCKEIKYKRQPFNVNWNKFKVGRPPDISIDAGRDSKAALAENIMALRSATSFYEETEDDFEEETERCFYEADFRNRMVLKYPSVKLTDVRQTTPNGNPNAVGDINNSEAE